MNPESVFLYGPPGSGKTTLGRSLALALEMHFHDLDSIIEASSGQTVQELFASQGEAGFRALERAELQRILLEQAGSVIALGGGTLVDPQNRALVEARGPVLLLSAPTEVLAARLQADPRPRPLLAGDLTARLADLLERRAAHYASFPLKLSSSPDPPASSPEQEAWKAQCRLGMFRLKNMGAYDVRILPGGLGQVGAMLRQRGLGGPIALVTDSNVGPVYAERVLASLRTADFSASLIEIPAGEQDKTIQTTALLWDGFLEAELERGSTVLALGGGVVSDLAGFAAATYLRGVRWVALPTSLLSMVDASLGGKTGADLPQGKNLIGAFHPPSLVLADPAVLDTLPEAELRSGLAEALKAGLIADPLLFTLCGQVFKKGGPPDLDEIVRRAMAVKIQVIEADPYEQGWRAVLNLGHTIGHAVELVSGFRLRHGEAVAIGMVVEASLAEELGLAEPGLAETIRNTLQDLGLPVQIPPELDGQAILKAMGSDKKRAGGKVLFALPIKIGEARVRIEVDETRRRHALGIGTARPEPESSGPA